MNTENIAALLDSEEYVVRLDPKGMYALTRDFPNQIRSAVSISESAALPQGPAKPDHVILTGLGGSAAGGDFVRALFEETGSVPFIVNRDYFLPSYAGSGSLVFACSYSGNTEETISAYLDARKKGASIIVVTSGGKLAEMAREDGFPIIQIPSGQPPRTALGYLLMPVAVACMRLQLIQLENSDALIEHLKSCVDLWSANIAFAQNPTKQLAASLFQKVSVIYGLGSWQGLVANRWKGQINENAKNMTFSNIFPELNHNEILGWVKADEQGISQWIGVILADGFESAKMKKRAEVTMKLTDSVCQWHTVITPGSTLLQKMLALALYGDFVSLYLASINNVDPENIDWINVLKSELASIH